MHMRNIKKTFPIFAILTLLTGFICCDKAFCISVNQEKELSRKIMIQILQHFDVIEDPVISQYIQKVGNKIVSVVPAQPFAYHFYILNQSSYNAFAVPGGNIFINSGLVGALSDEEELAGILAHEVAHVACRHISQKIDRSKKINIATLAGIAAGIFLGAGPMAGALVTGSLAAGQSLSLAYSREDETEADRLGLTYLTAAGYSGTGLLNSLKKIRTRQWFGSEQVPTYLNTHPASEQRISYIGSWLQRNGKKGKKAPVSSGYNFKRAQTRLIALYAQQDTAIAKFKTKIAKFPNSSLAHYGYGLVLDRIGNRKKAILYFKKALEKTAFEPYILADIGRTYFFDRQFNKAFSSLKGSISIAPDYSESHFFLGQTQIATKRLKEALNSFEKVIRIKKDHNQAIYFLGKTYGKLGNLGNAHFYLGLYYKNEHNLKNMAFHLQKAIKYLKDPKKRAKAEEMLKKPFS
jgi:beta-barrel assembly-enhancing protease